MGQLSCKIPKVDQDPFRLILAQNSFFTEMNEIIQMLLRHIPETVNNSLSI